MREFHGIAASPGIAIHHAFAHYSDAVPLPKYSISKSDIETEWERYLNAVERAAAEIRGIKENPRAFPHGSASTSGCSTPDAAGS
jgi:phosphotransferase system enzyme I (PtsI)